MTPSPLAGLASVVRGARRLGFVGGAPVEDAIEHARGFAAGVEVAPERFLDLGSGGGLPGLVLLDLWPAASAVLVDANQKRCAFLRAAVTGLGLDDRAEVLEGRAEALGRRSGLRGAFPVVTARGFGRPAVTAECAAPFLTPGGLLLVSEPPPPPPAPSSGDRCPAPAPGPAADRWPADGLALCGLAPDRTWATRFHYRSLRQVTACPDRYPRRAGIPTKRPLF